MRSPAYRLTAMSELKPEMSNICDGCPAAFALGVYADEASQYNETSPVRAGMIENEAVVAGEALNGAAGKIACREISKKPFDELPDTVPETGSSELIGMTAQCPAMPHYLHERTGQPVVLTKAIFKAARVASKLRKK